MTLKQELSESYTKAIAKGPKKIEPLADKEMRDMITDYIYPILRLIHKKCPTIKELKVSVTANSFFTFTPIPSLNNKDTYKEHYYPKLHSKYLIPAASRVCSEFDLEVLSEANNEFAFTFQMTLEEVEETI